MKTDELITMVDLYFDNELEKGKEPVMFSLLSQDEEAREHFKKMNILKNSIAHSLEEFPAGLDEKILLSVGNIQERQATAFINRKVLSVITYSAAIILLLLTIFFYNKTEEYKVQFVDLTREVKKQNDKIELLMNTLPEVEVTGGYLRTRQILVTPKL
jgi:hypothetical protein